MFLNVGQQSLQAFPTSDPRMSGPGAPKHHVVLAVKEVRYPISTWKTLPQMQMLTSIVRVQIHWLEILVTLQHRASPFPNPSHVTSTSKLVAVLSDRRRMPVFEAYVAAFEVDKELAGIWTRLSAGDVVKTSG